MLRKFLSISQIFLIIALLLSISMIHAQAQDLAMIDVYPETPYFNFVRTVSAIIN